MSRYARDPISGSILPVAGSGHTIVDSSDTVYAQRSKLKFKGLSVIDDSTDDETVVDASPIREEQRVLGAKNLLPNNATTQVYQGITFTVNDDKSVTTNGTLSQMITIFPINWSFILKKGDYILSGCPTGGGLERYYLNLATDSNHETFRMLGTDIGEGALIHIETDTYVQCRITLSDDKDPNLDINNLTFYPMLRLASDPDDTYVPYAMTNKELTEDVETLKTNLKATFNSAEIPFKFGIDASGNYGYIKAGADAVTPFKTDPTSITRLWYSSAATGGALSTNTETKTYTITAADVSTYKYIMATLAHMGAANVSYFNGNYISATGLVTTGMLDGPGIRDAQVGCQVGIIFKPIANNKITFVVRGIYQIAVFGIK